MATTITLQGYERAEREVMREEARRGFLIHAAAYVLVNLLLIAINLLVINQSDDNMIWFVFPLIGWGIGLTAHYVFGIRRLEANIEERQAGIEQRATRA